MNRRRLIGMIGLMVLAAPTRAAVRAPAPVRRLKLYNAHTHETFDGPYRAADGVIASAASELSEFLRDHHSSVAVAMDIDVIDFLWAVLSAVNAGSATVLSAYRTPATNAMLARTTFGVAEHSQHMYGRAIDFYIGSHLAEAMAAARAMRRGGVGWYPQSHFIHVDSGPVRNWSLGDGGLRDLLIDGRNGHAPSVRSASLGEGGSGDGRNAGRIEAPPRSQYGGPDGTTGEMIRPSQYSGSYGHREELVRPSQYSSTGDPTARPSQYRGRR